MANKKISQLPYIGVSNISGNTLVPLVTYFSAVTGDTVHTYVSDLQSYIISGLTGNTDVFVTGGTFSAGTITLTNNTGGTFNVTGVTFSGGSSVVGDFLPLSGGTVTGSTEFTAGLSANTISATTYQNLPQFSGGSGNCITDLFVSNIHSCSPLYINPLNEGNVYFGQTSGITVDVTNNRLGINNQTPTYPLDILGSGSNGSFYYTPSSAGGLTFLSGNTTTPTSSIVRYGIATPPYLSKPSATITFGIRGWGDSTYGAYGGNGDGFIRASVESNGLTIIKALGSGTNDYIRFFAGTSPTTTPNLIINGTGATQGFVGINTPTPTERLHVSGNTLISGDITVNTISATTYLNLPTGYYNTTGITSSQSITWDKTYWGISGSSNVDLTLPSTVGKDGYFLLIKDEAGTSGTYRIRLTPTSGLIDGNTYIDMNINYMSLTFVARNNNWWII